MNSVCLWRRARLDINKKQKHFLLLVYQLTEYLILLFLINCHKWLINFWQIFCYTFIFTDRLKRITVNKTTCRRPSANSCSNYIHTRWRVSQLLRVLFKGFRIFWFIWQIIFDQFELLLTWFFNLYAETM